MNRITFMEEGSISKSTVNNLPDRLFNTIISCNEKYYWVDSVWVRRSGVHFYLYIKMKIEAESGGYSGINLDLDQSVLYQGIEYKIVKISEERKEELRLEIDLEYKKPPKEIAE